MTALATSTFMQVALAALLIIPITLLWIVVIFDVFRHGFSGLKIAALLVLILIVPILGPLLYLIFVRPSTPSSAEDAYLVEADLRRQRARQSIGGTGPF